MLYTLREGVDQMFPAGKIRCVSFSLTVSVVVSWIGRRFETL